MNSVRRAALLWMTLLLTLVGLIGAGIAYALDLSQANELLDGQLRQIALNAAPRPTLPMAPASASVPEDNVVVQIWDADGRGLRSSDPTIDIPRQARTGFADLEAAGDRWRSFLSTKGGIAVQTSQRVRVRHELARVAALEAAVPILVTIPLGWLVVGWALQRILGKVTRLAGDIALRGVETKRPIPVTEIPVEVSPLVQAINALIGRLQSSVEQQRQFLSEAAHELRTPLAALRLQIDALQLETGEAAPQSILAELARGAERASSLVDQLLRLARYDAAVDEPEPEDVDLVPLVLACIADHVHMAERKRVDLGLVRADPAHIAGSPEDLRILFSNLIQNSVRYTEPGGLVDVAVRVIGARVEVEVADTGCGIRDDALPRVFDRFFRAAPADIEGTGLGLAICKAIATRHRLVVSLRNRDNELGLIATVSGDICPTAQASPSLCPSEKGVAG